MNREYDEERQREDQMREGSAPEDMDTEEYNRESNEQTNKGEKGESTWRQKEEELYSQTRESSDAERMPDGKYKCRICGQVFDTLEAHDEHHRKMHEREGEMRRESEPVQPSM